MNESFCVSSEIIPPSPLSHLYKKEREIGYVGVCHDSAAENVSTVLPDATADALLVGPASKAETARLYRTQDAKRTVRRCPNRPGAGENVSNHERR